MRSEKPANEFRIFCLGGSTVQGRPYAIETSFTTWLELSLQAADPQRQWQVVNCGGVSYASYRLAPIMQELLSYQPDLFIVCTGHNEFLEDRTYGPIKQAPHWIALCHAWLSRLHTYNALRTAYMRWHDRGARTSANTRPELSEEVEALLDYRGGLEDYDRDNARRDAVVAHFDFNLRRMASMAREHDVGMILINPVYNLKGTPPFKYAHRDDITPQQEQRFEELWNRAKREKISNERRIELLQRAITIDPEHAGVYFHLGKCYEFAGQYAAAKAQYIAAKDEDICQLRILSTMRDAIQQVASDYTISLVDAQLLFERLTDDHITGHEWLVDHVHPSIVGHQRLAAVLVDRMIALQLVHPRTGWQAERDASFNRHWQSLGPLYYFRGQQRLRGLRLRRRVVPP